MIEILFYAFIAIALYMVFKQEKMNLEIKRESDATIEVVCGRCVLKEK